MPFNGVAAHVHKTPCKKPFHMKVKFSGMGVVEGRGKINGTVASRNRAGAYLRVKVSPVNPQTTFQQAVRNRLTQNSQAWRSLTADQRAAWDGAVSDFARTDIFGDLRNPTGKNLYTRLNTNLQLAGQSTISSPPLPAGAGTVVAGTLVMTNGGAQTIAHTGDTAGHTIVVQATPGVSPGKSFLKNDYRNISTFTGGTASPEDIATEYAARFGQPAVGTKVGVRLISVNNLTGETSVASEAQTIVV